MTALDGAARLIGLPGKGDGVDGSQVEVLRRCALGKGSPSRAIAGPGTRFPEAQTPRRTSRTSKPC